MKRNPYIFKTTLLLIFTAIIVLITVFFSRIAFKNHIQNIKNEITERDKQILIVKEENKILSNKNKVIEKNKKELEENIRILETGKEKIISEKDALSNELELIQHPLGGVDEHGRLTAENGKIRDEKGDDFVLKGISSHGIAWFPEYTNYSALKFFKDSGANVFRVSMYVAQNDGYLESPVLNRKLLYQAVENSKAADLYTIIDWHVLRDENPLNNLNTAIDFFDTVSAHYGHDESIIYEICNEPNGDTTYEDIYKYAEKIIPVIRRNSPDAMIIVGTPEYCTRMEGPIEKPLPFKNIAYTYHFYAGLSDIRFAKSEIKKAIDKGLTVFVTEWGIEDPSDLTMWNEMEEFIDFLDNNKISWVKWALSNKQEGHSIIKSNVANVGKPNRDELTKIGMYVIDKLK